jgi:zinc and cadmium transporter
MRPADCGRRSLVTLITILLATFAAGIGSVWLAAMLMRLGWQDAGTGAAGRGLPEQHLLSLAAGALLSTAFMHLLPEAMESGRGAQPLFATLLVGLVFFFLLDKAELWHHGHEHHHGAEGVHAHLHPHHDHDGHGHRHAEGRSGGWAVLTGDSVHCFGDGILIASAFMANAKLGTSATSPCCGKPAAAGAPRWSRSRSRGPSRRSADSWAGGWWTSWWTTCLTSWWSRAAASSMSR